MKHLNNFEELEYKHPIPYNREKLFFSAVMFLNDNCPITEDEGFVECQYESEHPNPKSDKFNFYFCFMDDINVKILTKKFFKYIEDIGLTIEKVMNTFETITFLVQLTEQQVIDFAGLYESTHKYNL